MDLLHFSIILPDAGSGRPRDSLALPRHLIVEIRLEAIIASV